MEHMGVDNPSIFAVFCQIVFICWRKFLAQRVSAVVNPGFHRKLERSQRTTWQQVPEFHDSENMSVVYPVKSL